MLNRFSSRLKRKKSNGDVTNQTPGDSPTRMEVDYQSPNRSNGRTPHSTHLESPYVGPERVNLRNDLSGAVDSNHQWARPSPFGNCPLPTSH